MHACLRAGSPCGFRDGAHHNTGRVLVRSGRPARYRRDDPRARRLPERVLRAAGGGGVARPRAVAAPAMRRCPAPNNHRLPAATANPLAVAGRTPASRFDVVSTTPSASLGPCGPLTRHLGPLATKVDDFFGLKACIGNLHQRRRGAFGARGSHAELAEDGVPVGRERASFSSDSMRWRAGCRDRIRARTLDGGWRSSTYPRVAPADAAPWSIRQSVRVPRSEVRNLRWRGQRNYRIVAHVRCAPLAETGTFAARFQPRFQQGHAARLGPSVRHFSS